MIAINFMKKEREFGMNEPFFTEDDRVYVNADYIEAYIPEDSFSDKDTEATVACFYDEGVKTFGIFAIRVFPSEDTPRSKVPLKTFAWPNPIETYPTTWTTEKMKLFPTDDETKYVVLKYYKGDLMMDAISKQDTLNCEKFINFLTKGKFSRSISCDTVEALWVQNFQINKFNPGVPGIIQQMIISEMYRSIDNPILQFRKTTKDPNVTSRDGVWYNMNEVSSFTNVLSSLTFERISDKITTSLNMSKSDQKQNRSPVEKVLSM